MKKYFYQWDNLAGGCALAWTDIGLAVFRFGLRKDDKTSFIETIGGDNNGTIEIKTLRNAPAFIKKLTVEVNDYFSGLKVDFQPPLDFTSGTDFQKSIWDATFKIPYGTTKTYSAIARDAGHEGAFRAAGGALGANPIPVIVPCHRVIASDGDLGGFSLGIEYKRALLALETGKVFD